MKNSTLTSEMVLIALRQIIRAIDVHSKKLIKQYGLTGPQLMVLKEIDRKGKISLTQLAKTVSLSLATVSSLLDRLEKQSYIQRIRGEEDRRTFYACMTESGKLAIQKSPNLLQEQFLKKFEKLEEWEQHLILSSVQRIAAMMNAESVEAPPYLEGI